MLSPDDIVPEARSRTPSWTAQKLDVMLHDLRDNIRRLSTTVQPIGLPSCEPSTSSTAGFIKEEPEGTKNKRLSNEEEDAKGMETFRLILEASRHHVQYVALMEQALPIIEKLKAAKDGGFFTSLWAIIKGASRKTDHVKQLMQRADSEACKMRRKWERAEQLASELRSTKYIDMLNAERIKAAKQNLLIDARMAVIRKMD